MSTTKTFKRNNPLKEPLIKVRQKQEVSYAIHMHPVTQMIAPDILDHNPDSLFDIICEIFYTALPLILCFQLNAISSLINVYLIGNHENATILASIGLGTVIANIFAYMIIENISLSASVISSYFKEKIEVGFVYQKTLGINFFICVLITPILYLSDKMLRSLGFNEQIVIQSCNYVWALIPSFYVYSFHQTTRSYLQSQGVIYPPLVINSIVALSHLLIAYIFIYVFQLGLIGAAWAKNISDTINSLALYLFIIIKEPTKQSWVEWNMLAVNNVHRFILVIFHHQIFTYFDIIAFQLLCMIACWLKDDYAISAHISFSNTLIVVYFGFIGISHCLNKALSVSIEENNIKLGKKKVMMGVLIIFILVMAFVMNLWMHREWFVYFFHKNQQTAEHMMENILLFMFVVVLQAFQNIFMGIIKTLQVKNGWKIPAFSSYLVGLGSSWFLTYRLNWGLTGIWVGWSIGMLICVIYEAQFLLRLNWEEAFDRVRAKFLIIKDRVRSSQVQIKSDNQIDQ